MTAAIFDLTAKRYTSSVLARHASAMRDARENGAMRPVAAGENAVQTNLSADQLANLLGAATATASGVQVTSELAMRVAAVYACVSTIAGAISTLPLHVFERDGNNRKRSDHEYHWLFNEQANESMTSATAWEALLLNKLIRGDGIAELLRTSNLSSRVIGWRPLHRDCVQPFKGEGSRLYYRVWTEEQGMRVLDSADILHLPSLGFDGVSSPSPITHYARETIGTMVAAERYSGNFFSGGANFDYALKTASKLDKTQTEALLISLNARSHTPAGNRAPLILTGGLEPANLSVNPKDAEVLSTRLFGVEEICRMYGVPPHMIGHTDKTTSWGSGIEQQSIGFVRYTLQRHLNAIAQEINRKLWPIRQRYFVEHVTNALERGDLKSRYEAYRIALGRAGEQSWIAADEIRRLENMAPNADLNTNTTPGGANAQPTDSTAG